MKSMLTPVVFILSILLCVLAYAQEPPIGSTQDVADDCRTLQIAQARNENLTGHEHFASGYCIGVIVGFFNTTNGAFLLSTTGDLSRLSWTANVNATQIAAQFIGYVNLHPDSLKEPVDSTLRQACSEAGWLVFTPHKATEQKDTPDGWRPPPSNIQVNGQ